MSQDVLIGYRKVIALLAGLVATWLISKGMSPELASSFQGMLVEIIPTILSIIYMFLNVQSKKVSAPTAQITTSAPTAAQTISPTNSLNQPEKPQQQPLSDAAQPAMKPPVVDTMPSFDEADSILTAAQKQAIAEWYARAVTKSPQVPAVPKEEATLYMDIRTRDERRAFQAQNDIAEQSLEIFPGSELTDCYKLRSTCDARAWDRVNYHWREARKRWIDYGYALWQYQEA